MSKRLICSGVLVQLELGWLDEDNNFEPLPPEAVMKTSLAKLPDLAAELPGKIAEAEATMLAAEKPEAEQKPTAIKRTANRATRRARK